MLPNVSTSDTCTPAWYSTGARGLWMDVPLPLETHLHTGDEPQSRERLTVGRRGQRAMVVTTLRR